MSCRPDKPTIAHAIVQLTTFCNINCSYCYLGSRSEKNRVSIDTVRAVARRIYEYGALADPFHWQWHAGEPLTVGLQEYKRLHDVVKEEFSSFGHALETSLQTNGLLISDAWADYFVRERIGVGISIDGPAELHDLKRRTRRGSGTHAAALEGLRKLVSRGAKPSVICVVGPTSLEKGAEIISFFGNEGVQKVGFNFEEIEGENARSSFSEVPEGSVAGLVHKFIADVVETRDRFYPDLHLREFDNFQRALMSGQFGRGMLVQPFSFLAFGFDGQVCTFSPELAGSRRSDGTLFEFGNVHLDTLETIYNRVLESPDYAAIQRGVNSCQAVCDYFKFCGGGSPGNKLFENGRFDSTETQYCRLRYKNLVEGMLEIIIGTQSECAMI